MSEGLPEGFEVGAPRKANKGSIKVPGQQRGLDHFRVWGAALDDLLDKMDNADGTPWSVTFTATVDPRTTAEGADPGIVIEYIVTLT